MSRGGRSDTQNYDAHSKSSHHWTRRSLLHAETHMANITCDQTVSDTLFIIEHEHIFQWHTRICFPHRARPMYSNILQCQNIQAYVYTVHTHVTHITGRPDYTCPYMKLESCACIQGWWVRRVLTMQARVTDGHKSRLQMILHEKLRWWGINSQFGSAVVKLSL